MKKILIILIILSGGTLISLDSCSKSAFVEATVVKDGDGITTGCGWLLSIGGELFFPEGLREDLRVEGLVITIQYTVSVAPKQCVDNTSYPIAAISKYL